MIRSPLISTGARHGGDSARAGQRKRIDRPQIAGGDHNPFVLGFDELHARVTPDQLQSFPAVRAGVIELNACCCPPIPLGINPSSCRKLYLIMLMPVTESCAAQQMVGRTVGTAHKGLRRKQRDARSLAVRIDRGLAMARFVGSAGKLRL